MMRTYRLLTSIIEINEMKEVFEKKNKNKYIYERYRLSSQKTCEDQIKHKSVLNEMRNKLTDLFILI